MVSWKVLIAFVAVLSLVVMAGPASAEEESGTETIFGMDHFSVEFENTGDGEMRVSWDITVTDGVPVNVVLLDEENYGRYPGLAYEAYKGHQYNYVNSSKRTVRVEEGTYHLVVESAHSSMDSSTIDYEVSWSEGSGIFDTPWCWPAGLILALILGVLAALFGRGRTGGGAAMRSTAEMPPVPETSEAVELGPQPEPPDVPSGSGHGGTSEPTAPGTMVYEGPGGGERMLGPQPEPPDMPASDAIMPTGEGVTQLSPQPEPPDMPADAFERTVPDPLNPHAETLPARDMPTAHADPQPGPPGTEGGPPEPEEGMRVEKVARPPGDSSGDGSTGEPL